MTRLPAPSGSSGRSVSLSDLSAQASELVAQGAMNAGGKKQNFFTRLAAPVLGNRVAKTLFAPLELLSIPQRAVVSTIQSMIDTTRPDTQGEGRSWLERVQDPTYGFGTLAAGEDGEITGNKWADRLIGLAGDIATDPLTYLSTGAAPFASRSGRLALAGRLAAKNVGDDVVQRAGIGGISGLSRAERLANDLPQAAVRFTGVPIPATQGVAEAVGNLTSGARARYNASRAGSAVRDMRVNEELQNAITKLTTGRGTQTATEAAGFVAEYRRGGAAAGRVANAAGRQAAQLGQEMDATIRQSGAAVLEQGAQEPNSTLGRVRNWFDSIVGENNTGLLNTDFQANIPYRKNYVPHIWSDKGREILDSANEMGRDLRRILGIATDTVRGSQIGEGRQLAAGTHKIAGRTVNFGKGTIDEINVEMRRVFGDILGDADVLESDLLKIMDSYVGFAGDAAREATIKRGLVTRGIAKDTVDTLVPQLVRKDSLRGFKAADESLVRRLNPLVATANQAEARVNRKIDRVVAEFERKNGNRLRDLGNAATDEASRVGLDLVNLGERLRDPARRTSALTSLDNAIRDLDIVIPQIEQDLLQARTAARKARGAERRRLQNDVVRLQREISNINSVLGDLRIVDARLADNAAGRFDNIPSPMGEAVPIPDRRPATQQLLDQLPAAENTRYTPYEVRKVSQQVADEAADPNYRGGTFNQDYLDARQADRQRLLTELEEMNAAERTFAVSPSGAAEQIDFQAAVGRLSRAQRLEAGQAFAAGREVDAITQELLRQSGRIVDPNMNQVWSDLNSWNEVRDNLQRIREAAQRYIDEGAEIPKARAQAQNWRERSRFVEEVIALTDPDPTGARLENAMIRFGFGENSDLGLARAIANGTGTPEGDLAYALLADYYKLESELLDAVQAVDAVRLDRARLAEGKRALKSGDWDSANDILSMVTDGQFHLVYRDVIQQGWTEISERLGVAVPDRMVAMLEQLPKSQAEMNKLWKVWNNYIQFFKTYATLSPRFHIRNLMSAVFMNAAHGVTPDSMSKGFRLWNRYMDDPQIWNTLSAQEREVIDAVLSSGAGQFDELGRSAIGSKVTQNRVTNASYKAGQYVEGWVRAGMAWDQIMRQGTGFEGAVSRIEFVHFIYSDQSKLDRTARLLIPFWTFFSRNVPMQVQTMWTRPRAYAMYNNVMKNISADEEGDIVPSYLKDQGAVKLPFGDNLYLAPDIGFNRLQEDLAKLSPEGFPRLASDTIAPLRLAIEGLAGKRLYNDQPFREDRDVPVSGAKWALLPLMALLGGTTETEDGKLAYTDFANYATESFLPTLGQLERLFPQQEKNQQRRASNIASFFLGSPVRQVTTRDIENELYRRGLANR